MSDELRSQPPPAAASSTPPTGPDAPPPVAFRYRNHRGEVAVRKVIPGAFRYGVAEWHPGPQWLLDGFDVEKKAGRTFAVRDIIEWYGLPDMSPSDPNALIRCIDCGSLDGPGCPCRTAGSTTAGSTTVVSSLSPINSADRESLAVVFADPPPADLAPVDPPPVDPLLVVAPYAPQAWAVLVRIPGDPSGEPVDTGERVVARTESEALAKAGVRCATGRVAVRPASALEDWRTGKPAAVGVAAAATASAAVGVASPAV